MTKVADEAFRAYAVSMGVEPAQLHTTMTKRQMEALAAAIRAAIDQFTKEVTG